MPHTPEPETNEVQTAQAVDPAAICSVVSGEMIELKDGTFVECKNLINPGDPSCCHAANGCECLKVWDLID